MSDTTFATTIIAVPIAIFATVDVPWFIAGALALTGVRVDSGADWAVGLRQGASAAADPVTRVPNETFCAF